ncbi:hypothetical protein K438DRAFT_1283938 [Mycena galopus ATCC 62051]|nr:hypothetical protein K438DRAFT_1283938 [Mycena galopus ATCC 62051]
MSDDPKLPMPNLLDKAYLLDKFREGWLKRTPKHSPAPSPQPSRSTTPAPSNRHGPAPGKIASLPSHPESETNRDDNGREPSKEGGDTAKADKSGAVQSMPGVGRTYNVHVYGGTGGSGGQGGEHSGDGGTGEGAKLDIHNSSVYVTSPDATKIQFIEKELANHVTTEHKFTDQSKSLCAPGTRVQIQADILEWLSPEPGTNEHIFWITGIAGSGKSTLSATLVENLRKKGTPVAAQFFISRNIPETINPDKVIPTIAKQLSEFSPAAARIIHDTLKKGFPSSRQEQVEELLLAPIRILSKSHNAVIILIDALDELHNAAKSVLEILSTIAPQGCDLPDNIRFLITSRPEHWANISKSKTLELAVFRQLDLMTESSVKEVHQFIVARMKQITPSDWDDWPTREQLAELSGKANGLFHYAATALQWIEQQIAEDGETCQHTVFNQFTLLGIGQLNRLYQLILTSFEDIAEDLNKVTDMRVQAVRKLRRNNRLCGFQHVIGTILVLQNPLTISQIIALLADIPKENFDVRHFLQQMRSVLIPGTRSFEKTTPQMHSSFRDYIVDLHAPADFRIITGHAHFVTARSCMEIIVKAKSRSDIVVKYSVQHWYNHLRLAMEGSMTWEDGRMWNLLEQMMEEAVVNVWKAYSRLVFVDMAAAGWGLLKRGTNKHMMEGISRLLMRAKVRGRKCMLLACRLCLSCSLFLTFLSLGSMCFSTITHVCHA